MESLCGGIDESQPVELYDGGLGVTREFVDEHQAPVGLLQWNDDLANIYTNPGNVNGIRWCTGTLVSRDLFLSAGHCFDQTGNGWQRPLINGTTTIILPQDIATNMHVNFDYQVAPNGIMRQGMSFAVLDLVEYRLGNLDVAVVRLDGNPGDIYGWTRLATEDASEDDPIAIIQHPQGLPKRIEAGTVFHLHDNRLGYDDIDTLGGSSGSGILLSPAGTIVGVHSTGGCSAAAQSHNYGVRISSILAQSTALHGLPPPPPLVPDVVDPATALAPLGDNLIRVWHFSNATGNWTFYDPRPIFTSANTLTQFVRDQVYWIRVDHDETATLAGHPYTLFAGWNLVVWLGSN
jgi:V8-like Glu-specific endopeptidase